MGTSILAPIAAATVRNESLDFYGAIEFDIETGENVWEFNAIEQGLTLGDLKTDEEGVYQEGFRPSSVERLDNGLTLIADWRGAVWVDEDGELVRHETSDNLNDVHEVQKTDDSYLVANTGGDTIVEYNEDWEQVFEWKMWEHVDESTQPEHYYPDLVYGNKIDHGAFDPDQRYHLNYATWLDDTTILASALNYGIFEIDAETGDIVWEYTDLYECHNPTPYDDGYMVAESGAGRIVFVDKDGNKDTIIKDGLNFPKDVDRLPSDDGWLVTDSKDAFVKICYDSIHQQEKRYNLNQYASPYEADILTGGDSFV